MPWVPRIYTAEHVDGWKKITQAVHEVDGKIFCQLWHMGRLGYLPVGPSPIAANPMLLGPQGTIVGRDFALHPYEVSVGDINEMVED